MIEIKKEILSRLKEYEELQDFRELVAIELNNGVIIENVVLRNLHAKREKESIFLERLIQEKRKDETFEAFPFLSREIFETNRIGIDNVKRIFESPNKIPSELYDLLGRKKGNYTENESMFQNSFYVFCVKLRNNKNFNFKISKNDDFLELPKNYSFKDFGKIKKHKVFFNSKMYSYSEEKIQNNLRVIPIYENAMSYDCYIDMSEHFWRNKTSHNNS